METIKILEALPRLSIEDQLKIAEAPLELVRKEQTLTKQQRSQRLAVEALAALDDYESEPELTVFTELDGEDFYDYPEDAEPSKGS